MLRPRSNPVGRFAVDSGNRPVCFSAPGSNPWPYPGFPEPKIENVLGVQTACNRPELIENMQDCLPTGSMTFASSPPLDRGTMITRNS